MVGIAGSGKTTYTNGKFPDYAHVSLDKNRQLLPATRHSLIRRYNKERPLDLEISNNRKAECVQMNDELKVGKDVVVDDTNLTKETRRIYVLLAQKHGAGIRAVFFQNTRLAYVQNKRRGESQGLVPDDVLDEQHEMLEPPSKDEGFDSIQLIG